MSVNQIILSMKRYITSIYNQHRKDFFLYSCSGLLAFMSDYMVLQVIDLKTDRLFFATAAGILTGAAVSYKLNHMRFQIYHEEPRSHKESLPLFFALFAFNTFFTFACLNYSDIHFHLPHIVVKTVTATCIMVWNYMLFHHLVFKPTNHMKGEI